MLIECVVYIGDVMNLIQFEYFLKIVEKGSITAAANSLYITQPAISKQLALLEQELRHPLFWRKGKKLVLTPGGELLRKRLQSITQEIGGLRAELDALLNKVAGALRISGGAYTSAHLLPDLIAELIRRYPSLRPTISSRDNFVQELKAGRLDIMFGVIDHPEGFPGLRFLPLLQGKMVMLCAKESPLASAKRITPELLLQQPYLQYSGGYPQRLLAERLPFLTSGRCIMESYYFEALIAYVIRNVGFTIIPEYLLTPDMTHEVAVLKYNTGCSLRMGCLINPNRQCAPQLRAFLELIREKYPLAKET